MTVSISPEEAMTNKVDTDKYLQFVKGVTSAPSLEHLVLSSSS